MNERIRKLAKKSGFSLDQNDIYTAKLEHLPITENMEKFAELIVRECAHRSEELGQSEIGKGLMKHFGVEE